MLVNQILLDKLNELAMSPASEPIEDIEVRFLVDYPDSLYINGVLFNFKEVDGDAYELHFIIPDWNHNAPFLLEEMSDKCLDSLEEFSTCMKKICQDIYAAIEPVKEKDFVSYFYNYNGLMLTLNSSGKAFFWNGKEFKSFGTYDYNRRIEELSRIAKAISVEEDMMSILIGQVDPHSSELVIIADDNSKTGVSLIGGGEAPSPIDIDAEGHLHLYNHKQSTYLSIDDLLEKDLEVKVSVGALKRIMKLKEEKAGH